MVQVFIDGSAGTTGLRIVERLSARTDISLILLSDEMRKDPAARKLLNHIQAEEQQHGEMLYAYMNANNMYN